MTEGLGRGTYKEVTKSLGQWGVYTSQEYYRKDPLQETKVGK